MARNRETKGGSQELTAASCRHHLGPPPLLFVALLLLLAAPSYAADFTRTFTGITKGADLTLEWDGIDARSMPLTIHAVVVNRTGEENRANVFKRNLAVGINGTSWVWKNMPSPLPYLPTGLYQVEIKPEAQANATTGNAPAFPKSPYFSILDGKSSKPPGSPGGTTSPNHKTDGGAGGPSSKTISLAVGIVVTLAILLLAGAGCFCWRRRYMRAKRATKRGNKFDVVID